MKIRKLIRILHRDLSYFFAGMIIIYCISGIALNHRKDWNPNYIVEVKKVTSNVPSDKSQINAEIAKSEVKAIGEDGYKSFYFPKEGELKIFFKDGSISIDLKTKEGEIEKLYPRPVFKQMNFLHKNYPMKWWTYFSDIFALSLIIITITGLFLIKGSKGITGRGAVLTLAGIILPIIALVIFYSSKS